MNTTIKTALQFLANKAIAIVLTIVAAVVYASIQSTSTNPLPFMEVLYAIVLLSSVSVLAPFVRLMVFPEAATYAESGLMNEDLKRKDMSNELKHYWFATGISWISSIAAITSLL